MSKILDLLEEEPQVAFILALVAFVVSALPKVVIVWDRWFAYKTGKSRADLMMKRLELVKLHHEIELMKRSRSLEPLDAESAISDDLEDLLSASQEKARSRSSVLQETEDYARDVAEQNSKSGKYHHDKSETGSGTEDQVKIWRNSRVEPWRWVLTYSQTHPGFTSLALWAVSMTLTYCLMASGLLVLISLGLGISGREPGPFVYLPSSVLFGALAVMFAKGLWKAKEQVNTLGGFLGEPL